MRCRIAATSSCSAMKHQYWRPSPIRPPEARLEQREQPAPGPALAGHHQPGPGEHRPYARLLRAAPRPPPTPRTPTAGTRRRAARPRPRRGRRCRRSSRSRCRSRRPAAARPARRRPRRASPCRGPGCRGSLLVRVRPAAVADAGARARLTTASQPDEPGGVDRPALAGPSGPRPSPGARGAPGGPPRARRRSGTAPARSR